jgi:hypothetical protein
MVRSITNHNTKLRPRLLLLRDTLRVIRLSLNPNFASTEYLPGPATSNGRNYALQSPHMSLVLLGLELDCMSPIGSKQFRVDLSTTF